MKKLIASLSITVMFFSCQKGEDTTASCTNIVDPTPINIRIVNSSGADLLNATTPAAYDIANLQFSFVDNGSTVISPINVFKIGNTDSSYIKTSAGGTSSTGRTYYLKLSNTDTDTLYIRQDLEKDAQGCNIYNFKEFTYNGRAISRTNSQLLGGFFQVTK